MATWCSSDWHGCAKNLDKIFDFLGPDDALYFLGDAIDRGREGITILDKLFSDPRIRMIKGNHEEMMAQAIPFYLKDREEGYYDRNRYENWYFSNGGNYTVYQLDNLSDAKVWEYKKKIDALPYQLEYTSPAGHKIIMEHAGYSPFVTPHRHHDPLWDRGHFYDDWDDGFTREGFNPENTYLIHGHTPIQYLKFEYGYKDQPPLTKEEIEEMKFKKTWDNEKNPYKPTIIRYCDGHKFCVDCCTIVSKRIALLNLDTFKEIYFDEEN